MFECYENAIGLTDKDCSCVATGRPTDYNVSSSGLYLSQLMGINNLINIGECDDTMWDILTDSLDLSIKQLVTDGNALLSERFTLKRQSLKSQVLGQIKSKETVSPSKNYAVVRLNCCPIRGGIMTLKNIGTVFSQTGAVEVMIYDNVSGLLHTLPLNTVANSNTLNAQDIELPLYSKYVDVLEYYFVYLFDALNLPKNTKISCGCGTVDFVFNTTRPYYNTGSVRGSFRNSPWATYVMIGGLQINSLTEITGDEDLSSTSQNNLYGLNLEFDFSCKVNEVFCKDSLDFVGNPLAMSLSFALLYLTGTKIAARVLDSDYLTRANMIDAETWQDNITEWNTKYIDHMQYIAAKVDNSANDCLACKDFLQMTRQGLFS